MANITEALAKLVADDPNSKQKGNRFERLVQKIFQEHPGSYGKERFEKVWLWSEWPDKDLTGLPEVNGIDIVAKQTDAWGGGYCAIQCKHWNKDSSVGKGEIAKFLVDVQGSNQVFSSGLLTTNAKVTSTATQALLKSPQMCQVLYTGTMEDWVDDWNDWVDDFSNLQIPSPPKLQERDYQTKAREAAIQAFTESDASRGQIILPCGTGKMFVSLRTAEDYAGQGKTVLYLVPSLGLVHQTMQEWSEQRSIPLQYFGVCSDPSVAKTEDADPDVAGYMAEIRIPVTTDPLKIGEWLAKPAPDSAMRVLFSTYQSSPKIKQAIETFAAGFEFDLMILDEAHRTSGRDKPRTSGFVMPLHDSDIPAEKRLFFTATPRVFADKKASEDLDDQPDSYDMADEKVYGKVLDSMSFSDAIKQGYLSDYEVLVVTGSREAFRDSLPIQDGMVVWKEKPVAMDDLIRLVGAWDALSSPETEEASVDHPTGSVTDGHLTSAICYLNKVADSSWVATEWQDINDKIEQVQGSTEPRLKLDVAHVEAKTSSDKRIEAINALRKSDEHGKCSVVTNVGVFSEGVNVPSLDAVIFLDSRSSAVDIAQQIGRVMRKTEGKDKGYVVLPIFVPDEEDPDKWLESSDWKKLYRVVKALRSHDERMDEYLKHPAVMEEKGPITIRPLRRTGKHEEHSGSKDGQQRLFFEELKREVASKVVKFCGDTGTYPGWGKHAARVAANIATKLEELTASAEHKQHLEDFTKRLQESVSKDITIDQAREMLAQHVVTIPIFDKMLGKAHFADKNLVSIAIREMLEKLRQNPQNPFPEEAVRLNRAYEAMGRAFEGAVSSVDRLDVLKSIYDGFFAEAMPGTVDELGIVYTPVEIVDFIVRSCAAICRQEFGRDIGSENVHVLDPFSGTGTFLARLLTGIDLEGNPFVPDEDLERKYSEELHANELVLLAYYVAALTIEQARHDRLSSDEYKEFAGLCLSDTFEDFPAQGSLWGTSGRRSVQDEKPMYVVFGNPPWSSGKDKAGEGADKKSNPEVEKRVKETFVAEHKHVTGSSPGGNAYGNLYIQALRWASDRIVNPSASEAEGQKDHPSVVAFVHPNSLAEGTSLAGARGVFRDEFTDIFVVNLRGNAYKSGKERRKEGDGIFGGGSRNGVQITFLVRNPAKDLSQPANVQYMEVPEYCSLDEKWKWLEEIGDIYWEGAESIPVTPEHDWTCLPDPQFEAMMPVVETSRLKDKDFAGVSTHVAASGHASGVKTNCDVWAYSWSREALEDKIRTLLSRYQDALDDINNLNHITKLTNEIVTPIMKEHQLSGVTQLRSSLKKRESVVFEEWRIREVLYRPFTKLWLYEDPRIIQSVKTVSKMFPRNETVEAFEVTGGSNNGSPDSLMAVDGISDLNSIGPGRGGVASLQDGDTDNQWQQHDFPDTRDESADRSSGHQGFPTDQGDPPSEIDGGGCEPSNFGRLPLQHQRLHDTRDQHPRRSQSSRNQPSQPSHPAKAILLTAPANMAIFNTIATDTIPDLHSTAAGQQTRAMPRTTK